MSFSDDAAGMLIWVASALGLWVLSRSYRTGESPTAWPFEVTRATKPALYWFDMVIVTTVTAISVILGLVWLARTALG